MRSFKEYLTESVDAAVFKKAADFLDTTPDALEAVPQNVQDEVLDKGKELRHDFITAAVGKWVVRLFSALNKKFARVEAPTGKVMMYQSAKVAEAFIRPPDPYGTQYANPYVGQVEFASSELIDGKPTYKDLKAKVKSLVGDKHFELGTGDSYKTTLMSSNNMKGAEIVKLLKLKKAKVIK